MTTPRAVARAVPLRGNVPRLYAFRFLRDFLLIVPAIVPLYRSTGLDATQMLLVQAIFSAASVTFEIPSGYLADVIGRRRALLVGATAMMLGMAAYSVAAHFWAFAAAEVILAFGYSLFSGTESALMFDSLLAAGAGEQFQRLEGRAEAFTRVGAAVAGVLGGLLAGAWLRLPFAVNAVSAAIMLAIAWRLVEPPRERMEGRAPLADILRVGREALSDVHLRSAMLMAGVVFSVSLVALWGYLLRLTTRGVTVFAFGFYFAGFQVASGLAAAGSARMQQLLGRRGIWVAFAVIPSVFALCALLDSAWPVLAAPLHAAAWGFSTPLLLNAMNRRIESDRRATVLSLSAVMGRLLFVVLSPLFGLLTDRVSDRAAFAALAVAFALLLALAHALGAAGLKRLDNPAAR